MSFATRRASQRTFARDTDADAAAHDQVEVLRVVALGKDGLALLVKFVLQRDRDACHLNSGLGLYTPIESITQTRPHTGRITTRITFSIIVRLKSRCKIPNS